jgi:hypothetical protein
MYKVTLSCIFERERMELFLAGWGRVAAYNRYKKRTMVNELPPVPSSLGSFSSNSFERCDDEAGKCPYRQS